MYVIIGTAALAALVGGMFLSVSGRPAGAALLAAAALVLIVH